MQSGMTYEELQAIATDWHKRRFPNATIGHVGLKLCDEVGEVCSALLATYGFESATGDGDVMAELADVMIAVMALMGRWYPHDDLLSCVAQKLDVLTDPTSGHRSSLRE